VHLVGFTIEIYYDARPYERQIQDASFEDLLLGLNGIPEDDREGCTM